jgi:hypothetical protein
VPVGEDTLVARFSYDLPHQEGSVIELSAPLDVEAIDVVMISADLLVSGDGLRDAGWVDTQMGKAHYYAAGPLPAGAKLRLTVRGATATANPAAEAAAGAAVLLLGGVVSFRLWRPVAQPRPPATVRGLVAEIAQLDDARGAGRLEADPYRRQRQALVERARAALTEPPATEAGAASESTESE